MVNVLYQREHYHLDEYDLNDQVRRPLMIEKIKANLKTFGTVRALKERMIKDANALEATFAMKVVKWWAEQQQIKFMESLTPEEVEIMEAEAHCV